MKKVVLILFLYLSTLSFSNWEIGQARDEFDDLTGVEYVTSLDTLGSAGCRIEKIKNTTEYYIMFLTMSDYIGGKGEYNLSEVKLKVDNLKPLVFQGFVFDPKGRAVAFKINEKEENLFELLKKGSLLKVSIQKYDDSTILQKYNLNGFSKVFNEYNNSY